MNHNDSGCCSSHTKQCDRCGTGAKFNFTAEETGFLRLLSQVSCQAAGRFVLKSSRSEHLESVALAPVYLTDRKGSMETVRANAEVLKHLEKHGIIALDYDISPENLDYNAFYESDAYKYFKEIVREGSEKPDFIFDIGAIEFGSFTLTSLGKNISASLK